MDRLSVLPGPALKQGELLWITWNKHGADKIQIVASDSLIPIAE
jgi:hypothetical protein